MKLFKIIQFLQTINPSPALWLAGRWLGLALFLGVFHELLFQELFCLCCSVFMEFQFFRQRVTWDSRNRFLLCSCLRSGRRGTLLLWCFLSQAYSSELFGLSFILQASVSSAVSIFRASGVNKLQYLWRSRLSVDDGTSPLTFGSGTSKLFF